MPRDANERALYFGAAKKKYHENVNRWAIIVGISKYKNDGLNLKFAHNDANELYDLIRTPSGGAFEEKRICKFINEEATTQNVTRALRSFLQKPAAEDIVLVYFACHGAPDPHRPDVVYLLTHDTDPDDIPGTALPMREIDLALKENLHAERVVLIADSCHSASVGGKIGRRGIGDSAVINRYLEELSGSKGGLALLTSAYANESALEGEQWGGGHGVFTHFLLEGMRGKADSNKDGTVSVGELFEYVRDEVKRATNDAQHPVIGSNPFDPDLPLAITGGISAEDHLRLGICMNQLGSLLNEPARFTFARLQLEEAIFAAERFREELPEAQLEKGLAEIALGEHEAAVDTLRRAIEDDAQRAFPEAYLHLGVTLARFGNTKDSATSLKKYMELCPNDDRSTFLKTLASTVARTHVLLIGIGSYQGLGMQLLGPTNDLDILKSLLLSHYGLLERNIRTLIDEQATESAIMDELRRLSSEAKPDDQVLVYFSGVASSGEEAGQYLIPYGYNQDKPQSITAQQLHDALNEIPSRLKTMIIDSNVTSKMVSIAKENANYRLLLGTSPQLQSYETRTAEGLPVGQFSNALMQLLGQNPVNAPLDGILQEVAESLAHSQQNQEPIFIGDMSVSLLKEPNRLKNLFDAYDFSLRHNYDAMSIDEIRGEFASTEQNGIAFLQLYLSYGRAFLEKGQFQEALEVLNKASSDVASQVPEFLLTLGIAQLHCQDYPAAQNSLQRYVEATDRLQHLDAALSVMSKLNEQRKHALLVGIDQYVSGEMAPLRGAVNDVHLVKKTLIERCNFAAEDIEVLENEQATRGAIDSAFGELVRKAHFEPALFYFAGYGSLGKDGPAIVPVDRGVVSYPNDISLRELGEKAAAMATNLITIIDAGWEESIRLPYGDAWGSRYAPSQPGERPLARGLKFGSKTKPPKSSIQDWYPDSAWSMGRKSVEHLIHEFKIGRLSIYNVSIQSAVGEIRSKGGEQVAEAEFPAASGTGKQIHGVLTHALMKAVRESTTPNLTHEGLVKMAAEHLKWIQPFFVGDSPADALFSAPVQEREVHELVYVRMRQEPIRRAIQLLNRVIEKAGGTHALGNLNLAIAHATLGEYAESRVALEKAIEQSGKNSIPEAHYYLGRVLYEMDAELDLAVSELRKALEQDPKNVSAHYYFGHAVRKRTEQKTLVEATQAFEYYLNNGAPLGKRDEVSDVLARWSNRGTGTGQGTR